MQLGGQGPQPAPPPRERPEGFEIAPGIRIAWTTLAAICAGLLFLFVVVFGIGNVEVTQFALCSSLITKKVETRAYSSGRYWIGPFAYFIKFPAVVKTVQFSDEKLQTDLFIEEKGNPMLRSRTSEGLDLVIELSFQYQLIKEKLFELYTTMGAGSDFHDIYVRIAMDRITEIATEYTANEFFVDRNRIGARMEEVLRKEYEEHLFATIFSFQLRTVGLPQEFEKAIQLTEVKKQDVHKAEAEQNSTEVALETALMQAKRRIKVKAQSADAVAQSTMLANTADIEQYNVTQHLAADSYEGVLKSLDSKEGDLLSYIQSRVLRDHPSDKTTVGLSVLGIER
jgi:regulator of protease activity HflC (stomatin/prohibitin superfamily)